MSEKERRKYSQQFKVEAIALFEQGERSMAEVERELGLTKGLLAKWRERLGANEKAAEAFPGNGQQPASEGRLRELERENARLRMEKDILKKVLTMYSRDEG